MRWEDEYHAWDADATVHAKNLDFERRLESVLAYAPQQDDIGSMHGLWSGVMKFGVIPGAFLYLLYLMTSGIQGDAKETRQLQHEHNIESRAAIVRQDRFQGAAIDLLRAQCVNSAQDYQQRQTCLMAGSGR